MMDRSINQPVGAHAVHGLLDSRPVSLAGWYATPLDAGQVDSLCRRAQQAIQSRLRACASCFQPRVLLLTCCADSLEARQSRYDELARVAADRHEQALLELVYGQWLASRKLLPAMHHLAAGFSLAAPLLANNDYFLVLRRHERLASLPFNARPSVAQDLPALLNEAAVIAQLSRAERRPEIPAHRDTVG